MFRVKDNYIYQSFYLFQSFSFVLIIIYTLNERYGTDRYFWLISLCRTSPTSKSCCDTYPISSKTFSPNRGMRMRMLFLWNFGWAHWVTQSSLWIGIEYAEGSVGHWDPGFILFYFSFNWILLLRHSIRYTREMGTSHNDLADATNDQASQNVFHRCGGVLARKIVPRITF